MDEETVNATRRHYELHAGGNLHENQRKREEGPALPLKKFHNRIKSCLIKRFCYRVSKVLDLCCGRGGDIWKWENGKVSFVRGLDLSPGEIEEAWLRYDNFKRERRHSKLRADFQTITCLGEEKYFDDRAPYDVVACFFALHYFMASEDAIHNLLLNVSSNLKEGGYFIGTCPDGKRVVSALINSDHKHKVDTKMLKIVPKWEGEYKCFGSAYICAITDTVTEGHEESSGSCEYLVFRNVVKGIAAKFGLKLVNLYEDADELVSCFDQEDSAEGFKHFKPDFPESDKSLELASSLNMAFVFQKVGDFKKNSDGDYECEGFEDYTTFMPSAPLQGDPNRALQPGAQKRQLDEGKTSRSKNSNRKRKVKENTKAIDMNVPFGKDDLVPQGQPMIKLE